MRSQIGDQKYDWHVLSTDEVFSKLKTGVDGLSETDAASRFKEYGPNIIPTAKKASHINIFLHQFISPLIYILLISGAIAFLVNDIIDGLIVYAVLILNAIIGFYQEQKVVKSMSALKKLLSLKAIVVRDGIEHEIPSEHIVPGDIVLLKAGQKTPADIRFVRVKELSIDESSLTGESVPAMKSVAPAQDQTAAFPFNNIALAGTVVTAGRGDGIVIATGSNTQLGQLSKDITESPDEKTTFQYRFEILSTYIIEVTLFFGVLGFAAGYIRGEDIFGLFLAIVAMLVAVVPEGLPVILTIAFATSVNRLAKSNVIIRHLPAIETLGSSTTICSDKTGTLTKNEMTVRQIWTSDNFFRVNGDGYNPNGIVLFDSNPVSITGNSSLEWTLRVGLLANESNLVLKDTRWIAQGDPTEVALIVSAYRGGLDDEKEKFLFPRLDLLPFDSMYQYMATLHRNGDKNILMVKGAPETIVSLSDSIFGVNNSFNCSAKTKMVTESSAKFADNGLRVLAMAFKEIPSTQIEITHNDIFALTFLGLQGMMDPPRPDAIEAIKMAKLSGIRVLMITGDNAATALFIGKTMGISTGSDIAISGLELDRIDDKTLDGLVERVQVFARTSPHHKLRIINALKAKHEIVTVTGDGVNDAAALRAAHVGVAMGITGTDVAKEASDMVVLDDNFASIYRAIIEGRVAFDNIRKATYFLLSIGFAMLIAVFATIVSRYPLILLPAQILWLNLVTSGLQDISLAFEPKEPDVERRPPRDIREGILSNALLARVAIVGITIASLSLVAFQFLLSNGASLDRARTFALTTMVFCQFYNVFNARSESTSVFLQNPFNNRFLLISVVTSLFAQMVFIYSEFMQSIFHSTSLSASDLLISFSISVTVLLVSEAHKLFLRKRVH